MDGFGIAAVGAGAIFCYAGIKGISILKAFQNVVLGKNPNEGQSYQPLTSSSSIPSGGSAQTSTAISTSAEYDSTNALQSLWVNSGGAQDTAAFAAAVGMSESGGSATITSPNPDGGINVGIFQLDTRGVGAGYSVAQLQNPNLNARITIQATNNGTNWSEWGDAVTQAVGYHYTPGDPIPKE